MAYIGVQPAEAYTSFAVQHFTTSATTSYTLDHSVANENEIALFINNVRQEPGSSYAYTATGTALTLSAATAASDTMYCVFIGKAVQTVTPGSDTLTASMISTDTSFDFPVQIYFGEETLTDGANIDWNLQTQQVAKVTLGGNRTLNSTYKFTGATAPTLTTTASAKDLIVFRSDGTNLLEVGRSLNIG